MNGGTFLHIQAIEVLSVPSEIKTFFGQEDIKQKLLRRVTVVNIIPPLASFMGLLSSKEMKISYK